MPGRLIREHGLRAATDVTGFGLGGHLLEMSKASGLGVELFAHAAPVISDAYDLARQGFVPVGSHANRKYFADGCDVDDGVDPLLLDLIFDAQTSGGMVLAVPEPLVDSVCQALAQAGDLAAQIGRVLDHASPRGLLHIRP
ncbi:MAG: selenide water [Desulfovibrionaceae bacterium]|nr:MAG: selenide water [Desulfovibrionaceae bacterium]